jgi:hypothetical protein
MEGRHKFEQKLSSGSLKKNVSNSFGIKRKCCSIFLSVMPVFARRGSDRLGGPVDRDLHVGRVELGENRVPVAVRNGDFADQFQDAVSLNNERDAKVHFRRQVK